MCLLTFIPEGIMPDENALSYGATFNDDGHGYAIVDLAGQRIVTGHGSDAVEMIAEFSYFRERYLDGPALFHSRFATDGSVNLLNVHPFEVGGDPRTVLAHNGIMPLRPDKGDPRSDTRLVAEQWIPKAYGTLRRRRARLAFERWMSPFNKVVILTVDRRYRAHGPDHSDNAFILNESSGTWDNGIWYSNSGYKPWMSHKSQMSGMVTMGPRGTGREGFCWKCGLEVDFRIQDECPVCGVCFDCAESKEYCLCYSPSRFRSSVTVTHDSVLWRSTGLAWATELDE
jgi:glutamine amidotransferase